MRIFLGNGPWSKPGFYGVRAGSRWPHYEQDGCMYMPFPFYMAYASAMLKADGHEITMIDGVALRCSEAEYLNAAQTANPQLALVEVSTPSLETDLRQARAIKASTGARIVFAGIHFEMYEPQFLEQHPEVDYVLLGEYEETLCELAKTLDSGPLTCVMPGLNYRAEDGSIVIGGRRTGHKDIDSFPWPDRAPLPMHNYHDCPGGIPMPSLQVWASRGCPHRCSFCVWPQLMYNDHLYRKRNPEDIADEIDWCVKKWGVRSFYFDDDTFNIGDQHMLDIAEALCEKKLNKLPWGAMGRADGCSIEALKQLKKAGLYAIKYGVESGNQQLINDCGKGLNLAKLHETVAATHQLGIKIHLTFTFGLPGETEDTAQETIQIAKKLNPDSVQFSILTPFPGSRFYHELKDRGHLLSEDWSLYDGYNVAVVRTDALTGDRLEFWLKEAYRAWTRHKIQRAFTQPRYIKRALSEPIATVQRFLRDRRNNAQREES